MAERPDGEGWAPLDPGMTGEPPRPEQGPAAEQQRDPSQGPSQDPWENPPQDQPESPRQPGPYAGVYGVAPAPPPGAYPGPQQPGAQHPGMYGMPGMPPPAYGPTVKRSWTVPTPPGQPYHHMARTSAHRWWKPIVGTLGIVAAGFATMFVLMFVVLFGVVAVTGEVPDAVESGDTSGDTIFGDPLVDVGFNLASIAAFLPFVLLFAWWVQRRRPGTLSSVAGRLRWKWLLACTGMALLFLAVSIGANQVAGLTVDDPAAEITGDWVGWGRFLLAVAVIVPLVPLQATAEEYAFRGWLLQGVGACTLENRTGRVGRAFSRVFRTPWPGIVVASVFFTSGHGYTGWGIVDVFMFGAVAAILTVRTGGLEAAIALHVLNNLMAFLLPAAVGELTIQQGSIPWQIVAADVVAMAFYAAVVLWLAKRMRIQRVTPGADPEPAPGDAAITAAAPTR